MPAAIPVLIRFVSSYSVLRSRILNLNKTYETK